MIHMLTYSERAERCANPTAKRLLSLMDAKQTNLSLAADLTSQAAVLEYADMIGPEICVLKTHIDIIEDFDPDMIGRLQELGAKHDFLIFEDRKFADIGNTVQYQYRGGVYHIVDWADITNAHSVPGPGIIEGLKEIGLPKGRGLLLLAEMSSEGTLATGSYTEETLRMAREHADFVIGFITTKKLLDSPNFINFTPGVQLQTSADALKQIYRTPEQVIGENGTDIIIVGRGIYEAHDPLETARHYREAGWSAYENRLRA